MLSSTVPQCGRAGRVVPGLRVRELHRCSQEVLQPPVQATTRQPETHRPEQVAPRLVSLLNSMYNKTQLNVTAITLK